MGVTFKARDVNLDQLVALKVIQAGALGDEGARQTFVQEARAAAKLRQLNVATVYHLGRDEENFFYAMEYIEGETAQSLIEQIGPLPVERALRIVQQAARALVAAGRVGLVHRDLKPANLMIVRDHAEHLEGALVKVIDFGLAHPAGQSSAGFSGTPQYASPEQAEERALDARSDLYSLGCILWFLLTGAPPFTGSLAQILTQHLSSEPAWSAVSAFPAPVRNLLRILLRKNPAERPRDAMEAHCVIEMCLAAVSRKQTVALKLREAAAHARRKIARTPRSRACALLIAAVLLASTLGFILPRSASSDADAANASSFPASANAIPPALRSVAAPSRLPNGEEGTTTYSEAEPLQNDHDKVADERTPPRVQETAEENLSAPPSTEGSAEDAKLLEQLPPVAEKESQMTAKGSPVAPVKVGRSAVAGKAHRHNFGRSSASANPLLRIPIPHKIAALLGRVF